MIMSKDTSLNSNDLEELFSCTTYTTQTFFISYHFPLTHGKHFSLSPFFPLTSPDLVPKQAIGPTLLPDLADAP